MRPKPGDTVFIYSADWKTLRGTSIVERVEPKGKLILDYLPAGTTAGDILSTQFLTTKLMIHEHELTVDEGGLVEGIKTHERPAYPKQ